MPTQNSRPKVVPSTYTPHHSALAIQAGDDSTTSNQHDGHYQPGLFPSHAVYEYAVAASIHVPATDHSRPFAPPPSPKQMHVQSRQLFPSVYAPEWVQAHPAIDSRFEGATRWAAKREAAATAAQMSADPPDGWQLLPITGEPGADDDADFDPKTIEEDFKSEEEEQQEEDDDGEYEPGRVRGTRRAPRRKSKKKSRLTLKKRSKRAVSIATTTTSRPSYHPHGLIEEDTDTPIHPSVPMMPPLLPPPAYLPTRTRDPPVVAIPFHGAKGRTKQLIKLTNIRGNRLEEYIQNKGTSELEIDDLLMVHPPTLPPSDGSAPAPSTTTVDGGQSAFKDPYASVDPGVPKPAPFGLPPSEWEMYTCRVCDSTYQGKNARSVARRHLQDKHNVPLSFQNKRSRWQKVVPGAPTSEAEARERALTAKRVWAAQNRPRSKERERKRQAAAEHFQQVMGGLIPPNNIDETAETSQPGWPPVSEQLNKNQKKKGQATSRARVSVGLLSISRSSGSSQAANPLAALDMGYETAYPHPSLIPGQDLSFPAAPTATSAHRQKKSRHPPVDPKRNNSARRSGVLMPSPLTDGPHTGLAVGQAGLWAQQREATYVSDRALEVVLDQHQRNLSGDGAWYAGQIPTPTSAAHGADGGEFAHSDPRRPSEASCSGKGMETPFKYDLDPEALAELVRLTQSSRPVPSSSDSKLSHLHMKTPSTSGREPQPGLGDECAYPSSVSASASASATAPKQLQSAIRIHHHREPHHPAAVDSVPPRTSQRPAHQQWVPTAQSPWRGPWTFDSQGTQPNLQQPNLVYPAPQTSFGWYHPAYYMYGNAQPSATYVPQLQMTPAPSRRTKAANSDPDNVGQDANGRPGAAAAGETEGIAEALLILSTPAQPKSERPARKDRQGPTSTQGSQSVEPPRLLTLGKGSPSPDEASDLLSTSEQTTLAAEEVDQQISKGQSDQQPLGAVGQKDRPRLLDAPDISDGPLEVPTPLSRTDRQGNRPGRPLISRSLSLIDAFPTRGPLPTNRLPRLNRTNARGPSRAHSYSLSGGMEGDDPFFTSSVAQSPELGEQTELSLHLDQTLDTPLRQVMNKRKIPAGPGSGSVLRGMGGGSGKEGLLPFIQDLQAEQGGRMAKHARLNLSSRVTNAPTGGNGDGKVEMDGKVESLQLKLSPLKLSADGTGPLSADGVESEPSQSDLRLIPSSPDLDTYVHVVSTPSEQPDQPNQPDQPVQPDLPQEPLTRRAPLVQLRPNVRATSPLSLVPRLTADALKTPAKPRAQMYHASGVWTGNGWGLGVGSENVRRDGLAPACSVHTGPRGTGLEGSGSGSGGGGGGAGMGGQMSSPLNRETAKALGLAPVWQRTPGFGETPR